MNPHILFIIDHNLNPDKYTKEQLDKNADAAYDAYDYAATYTVAYAAYAAATACYACYHDDAHVAAYRLGRYFKQTGENKQDYIDEINKENNND